MEETLGMLVARCGKMDQAEEEAVKKQCLELSPPEIWRMTPEEVVKTAIMLNRNPDARRFDIPFKIPSVEETRKALWWEMA